MLTIFAHPACVPPHPEADVFFAQAGPPDKYAECLPAGAATDCQFGLTLAHRNVWSAIADAKHGAAWVFECALRS